MNSFHGDKKHKSYFEGWYFKQQSETDCVAFIPAFHTDGAGRRTASLQIVTDKNAYSVNFPIETFSADRHQLHIQLGGSVFSHGGCHLAANTKDLSVSGELTYGPLTPPAYDIMGPFRFLPLMECRHSVFSMNHRVNGEIIINGRKLEFTGGSGYIEGDRGTSFPSRYIWTHCGWGENCVMLSIADIPFCGRSFTGCIGLVYVDGKEYRIATYLGVNILHISGETVIIRQGELVLQIRLIEEGKFHLLSAPVSGDMARRIHESLTCRVRYSCFLKDRVLFDFESSQASYENNWAEG